MLPERELPRPKNLVGQLTQARELPRPKNLVGQLTQACMLPEREPPSNLTTDQTRPVVERVEELPAQ